MPYVVEKPLPPSQDILTEFPLDQSLAARVAQDREEIKAILDGRDPRKMIVIGPCSAWPQKEVLEYAHALKPVADQVSDQFKIVLRTYIQKPRTTTGWLGSVNQPNPCKEPDIEAGTRYCRQMMIEAIKIGFPLADEALFTHNDSYFVDLLSWIAIGARSSEDQEHRIFASMIDYPVGLKNPTSGDIKIGINSVIAAQYGHVFAFHGQQIRTTGNPHAHLILRGGNGQPNYQTQFLQKAHDMLLNQKIKNPQIMVDLSHDNSIDPETGKKDPSFQPKILNEILTSLEQNPELNQSVKSFMVESFLVAGQQKVTTDTDLSTLTPGQSITDGCLGLEDTFTMLRQAAKRLRGS